VQIGAKVIVVPQTAVARSQQALLSNAYAPLSQSPAQATWTSTRPSGRY
jgi:hypothetical protein